MVRKQVYIEQRQERLLKRRARELRVPEAELIRRGIDQIGRFTSLLPNREESWRAAKRLIGERMKMRVAQTGRTWRREDLYEQRLGSATSRH
jgi:hypothetical protein